MLLFHNPLVLNDLNHLSNLRVEVIKFWILKQGISGIACNANFILYASCLSSLVRHVCRIAKSDCSFAVSVCPHGTTWLPPDKFL